MGLFGKSKQEEYLERLQQQEESKRQWEAKKRKDEEDEYNELALLHEY